MLVLGEILRRHALYRPGKLAYVVGAQRVTYGEFNDAANRLANELLGRGVRRGDRVAVLANNCVEYPQIYFGVLKIGAIVVPVNARFKAEEISYVVDHSAAQMLLVAAEFADAAAHLVRDGRLPRVRSVLQVADLPSVLSRAQSTEPDVPVAEQDPQVILYTSGTTGDPKGAVLSHRSYYLQAASSQATTGLTEEDVGLSMFPMFHMGGWALPLGFWYNGASVVIMPKAEPGAMLYAIERERVSYLYAVPTVYAFMMAHPEFARFDLGSLRIIASGTAAMTREQVFAIIDRFRCANMFIMYGSTEAGPVAVLRPGDIRRKPETVGRPAPNTDVRVVRPDGSEAAAREIGEIAVRSEFTMLEYWLAPEETRATLRGGWLHTGDLGSRDEDGFLSIAGRLKEVIRSAGESILPVEVERVLMAHPDVAEASVLGVPDPEWGEAVAAAVIRHPGSQVSEAQLVSFVRDRLASFKKPKHVLWFDELPRTASSRQVQKPLLRELVLERLGLAARG
jgi:fatty-acyl-CoA synthase